jgi:hypothetical protein
LKALREARDVLVEGSGVGVPAQRAIEWLQAIAKAVQQADVPKDRSDLMHAIYERIVIAGPEIVGVRLTAAAYAHEIRARTAHQGCFGAPDRCWARDYNLHDPDRGSG